MSRRRLTILRIAICLCLLVAGSADAGMGVVGMGGGVAALSSAYYYAGDGTYTTAEYPYNENINGAPVVCSLSGTITRIGIYVVDDWGGRNVKIGIYTTAGNLHETAVLAVVNGWNDHTLSSSLACSTGASHSIAFIPSGTFQTVSDTSANGYWMSGQTYSGGLPSTNGSFNTDTGKAWPVRIYVEF